MRRRRGLGIFGFIIILAFLDLLPGMLVTLLPVAILGVIGVAIYKIIQLLTKTDSPKSNYYNKTTVKQNTNTSIVKPKKYEEIDKVLFSELPIKKKRIALRKLRKDKLEPKYINMFIGLLEFIETK